MIRNLLLLYLSTFIVFGCKFSKPNTTTLPSFNIQGLDSISILKSDSGLYSGPTVLLFFSPDCIHCQKETEDILSNINEFRNTKFLFISIDPLERLRVFNSHYKLFNYSNIIIGRDYGFYLPSHFKNITPPFLLVYDRQKKARAYLQGEVNAAFLDSIISKF